MKTKCTNCTGTRRASISKLTKFLEENGVELFEYLYKKKPAFKPNLAWWLVIMGLDSVASVLSRVVTRLQGLPTLLGEQEAQLED